jgi:hypothetical protein
MGLDSVEIVMGWEEEFAILIPDDVACGLLTPRLATDYIFRQVEQRSATECIRQQTFFRLRRGFRRAVPDFLARFEPATKLSALASRRGWPQVWSAVRLEAPTHRWPELPPFRGPLAFRTRTLADLVQELALSDPRATRVLGTGWTREQVSLQVRRVVEEVVGTKFFDEDDEFVRDVGIQ